MKNFIIILLASICIGLGSCTTTATVKTTTNSGHVPPGQMKKATGAKSAKQYAPGQQKKK